MCIPLSDLCLFATLNKLYWFNYCLLSVPASSFFFPQVLSWSLARRNWETLQFWWTWCLDSNWCYFNITSLSRSSRWIPVYIKIIKDLKLYVTYQITQAFGYIVVHMLILNLTVKTFKLHCEQWIHQSQELLEESLNYHYSGWSNISPLTACDRETSSCWVIRDALYVRTIVTLNYAYITINNVK